MGKRTQLKIQMEKYAKMKAWDKNKELSEFEEVLDESLISLVLLRAESKDVKKGNSNSQATPFRTFDKAVFNCQLKGEAKKENTYSKKVPNLNDCIFKELQSKSSELANSEDEIKSGSVGSLDKINVENLEKLKETLDEAITLLQAILNAVDSYNNSKHCKILERVRCRKQFFVVFRESLENFNQWCGEICKK